MDREKIKKAFDSAKAHDGVISVTTDAWNILAKEVDRIIIELERENMLLRRELDTMLDLATLPQPGVNIENVTVNYYAGAEKK